MNKNIDPTTITKTIEESFKKLRYKPRGNQVDIVFDVVKSFLIDGKKNVVLGAPTGIGKSILGAVIAETMDVLTPTPTPVHDFDDGSEKPPDTPLPSIIAMGQNSLALQYAESFTELGDYEYFQAKGANNYPCAYMQSQPSAVSKTAEECVISNLHETEVKKYCNGCEYKRTKKLINATRNLITNYTYFMISVMASGHLKPRKLHIFDEAHTFNQWYCSYTEIMVSSEYINKVIKELSAAKGKCDNEAAGLVMLKKKIEAGEVAENNYTQVLKILVTLYKSISLTLSGQAIMLKTAGELVDSKKLEKMSRKYALAGLKIADFFDNEYEHVFDNTVPNTITIKTIFVGEKMMERFLTDHNLFMSATITESYAFDILGLKKDETEIIQLPSVFPPENKPLFFIGKQSLNYNTMKEPETIETIKNQMRKIVEFHTDKKGLVLVPSFYLGNQLSYGVKYTRVFEHKSGANLSDLVSEFKAYKGSSILVSPSIYEGLSFDEDAARFQIIVKSPFDSLGDKRIKYIADNYPKIYQEMTLLKIIQGTGRGVRSPTDQCSSFFLDASSKKLFDSKSNIWKNHFTVMSK